MKRTLESYFPRSTAGKKLRTHESSSLHPYPAEARGVASICHEADEDALPPSTHKTFPFPIPQLPGALRTLFKEQSLTSSAAAAAARTINDQPDLDLLYFEPFVPREAHALLFRFLRAALPFYRVEYTIQRPGSGGGGGGGGGGDGGGSSGAQQPAVVTAAAAPTPTLVRTPRFTTVFGVDVTSRFATMVDDGGSQQVLVDAATGAPVPAARYRCTPRPIPECLDTLRLAVERATNHRFNFCLVNYYASGADSIAYHSDDEAFLGPNPAIASLSLGAPRDFLMKHKPGKASTAAAPSAASSGRGRGGGGQEDRGGSAIPTLKLALASGDMVVMRGPTQAHWLHSIPKRKTEAAQTKGRKSVTGGSGGLGGLEHHGGRINITFRNALVRGGTENYYRYNVGAGPVYRWDAEAGEMRQRVVDEKANVARGNNTAE